MTNHEAHPFLALLKEQNVPLGSWLMAASSLSAEAMGHAGFDWLVVDMEHVPLDYPGALALLQAIAGTRSVPVLRVAWNDPVLIKRALDIGAQTLMVPFVQNAQDAEQAVSAMKYPPQGVRGFAAMTRASRFGTITDYARHANAMTACMVQIETPEAVAQLEKIAAVPGVDALFVGPGDLAATLGHIGQIDHPEVQAVIEDIARRARLLNKPIGILCPNPQFAIRFREYGYGYLAIASDLAMMMRQAQQYIGAIHAQAEKPIDGAGY